MLPPWLLLHTLTGLLIGALEADRFQFMATLVFSGLFVGIAQWFVLRRFLSRGTRWIWVSAIGWFLGIQIMIALGSWLDPIVAQLVQAGGAEVFWLNVVKQPIVFLMMGTAQSLLLRSLRGQVVAGLPGYWIMASGMAGVVQGGASSLFCGTFCPVLSGQMGTVLTTAIVYGVGWFGYSLVTAVLLSRLLFPRVF